MKNKKVLFFLCLSILVFHQNNVEAADVIKLKSGKVVEGTIVKQTNLFVRLRVDPKKPDQNYLIEDIESINAKDVGLYSSDREPVLPVKLVKKLFGNSFFVVIFFNKCYIFTAPA